MDLADLTDSLPNGFHDAELRALEMDFTSARLRVALDVWVGDMDDPAKLEAYRSAQLTIDGVTHLVIGPPGSPDLRLEARSITIDTGLGDRPGSRTTLPAPLPGHFRAYLFLGDLNTFLHVVGRDAVLEWRGDEWVSGSSGP